MNKDEEIQQLKQWVNDLQSGMYINCVYCGHRYGPKENTPDIMADVLKKHIEQCPQHPLSELKKKVDEYEADHKRMEWLDTAVPSGKFKELSVSLKHMWNGSFREWIDAAIVATNVQNMLKNWANEVTKDTQE